MTQVTALLNAKPGTGKTTCSMFIAAALTDRGRGVLLVDADPAASAIHWSELAAADGAEGLPWDVIGMPKRTLDVELRRIISRGTYDHIVIDTPQMEDHAPIVRAAMRVAGVWLVPVAPAGIEIARMTAVGAELDRAAEELAPATKPARCVLLNRTNRRGRSQHGPDALCAKTLGRMGYTVLGSQIPHNDSVYRQSFGVVPHPGATPFVGVVLEVEAIHA